MTDAGERARAIVKDFPSWQYDTHGWFFCVWCFATTAKREVRYPDPKPGEAVAHIEPENPDAHNANCLLIDVPKRIAAALTDLETANAELTAQRDVKEAELENALLVAAERLEARDTLKAEVERLRDAARDMMHAMGKHTVSCSTCKEMLRRHAETLRCCDDPAAQSGPGA